MRFGMMLLAIGFFVAGRAEAGQPSGQDIQGSFVQEYGATLAPLSFVKFCMDTPRECEKTGEDGASQRSLQELRAINVSVNHAITPMAKPTEPLRSRWTVEASAGDCNDYAVTKRHRLIAAGWPSSRLRLAVAITQEGVGHLVLIARTSGSDMVLDNLSDEMKPWSAVPYSWISIQSEDNPRFWVAIGERGRLLRQRYQTAAAARS